jgi:HprK-related kinase A
MHIAGFGCVPYPNGDMMNTVQLGVLSTHDIEHCLRGAGLGLAVASFRCLIQSDTGLLSSPLRQLYQDYPADPEPSGFYDFRIRLARKRPAFWKKCEVAFDWEGRSPYPPLPLAHAHPLFEWGLNWCVATASGVHTVIHSAVVEREGRALVLPAQSGAGKSTLCAALALNGWRLLSDELTIVSHTDNQVQAVPRPISLKGNSIDLIRQRFPSVDMTLPVADTHKGAIAYARAPSAAVAANLQSAPIGYVVFPRFTPGAELVFEPLSRAAALTELMKHTFNVGLLGAEGFVALARAIAHADCYAVEYGDLASILHWVETTCHPHN